jgi:hypothetical protein
LSLSQSIARLGPYQSLLLVAVPTAMVEPLKLVAVAIMGKGHWIAGPTMIIVCYLVSFFLVERLFKIVKPKLMVIPWFAKTWSIVLALSASIASAARHVFKKTI